MNTLKGIQIGNPNSEPSSEINYGFDYCPDRGIKLKFAYMALQSHGRP